MLSAFRTAVILPINVLIIANLQSSYLDKHRRGRCWCDMLRSLHSVASNVWSLSDDPVSVRGELWKFQSESSATT